MKYYVYFDEKIAYFKSYKSALNFAKKLFKDSEIGSIELGVFNGEEWDGHSALISLRFDGR